MGQSSRSNHTDHVEAILRQMRQGFVAEIPERCARMEALTLKLAKTFDTEDFDRLYREAHSLKGSGGSHGLNIITTICHQLENLLTDSSAGFTADTSSLILAHVDLLRKVAEPALDEHAQYADIELQLEHLIEPTDRPHASVLVADTSKMMQAMIKEALGKKGMHVTLVDDGFTALQLLMQQKFDSVVLARELHQLGGVAVAAAVRHAQGKNADVRIILVTSNQQVDGTVKIDHILVRDRNFSERFNQLFEG